MQQFCLVCKDYAESRYALTVEDSNANNSVKGFVCRFCYHNFIASYYNEGMFKVSRLFNWIKAKKDKLRVV